jgi:hypothetical protein
MALLKKILKIFNITFLINNLIKLSTIKKVSFYFISFFNLLFTNFSCIEYFEFLKVLNSEFLRKEISILLFEKNSSIRIGNRITKGIEAKFLK